MLEDLLNSKNYMDIYIVARWAYKMNAPIFTDSTYDKYEEILKQKYPTHEIFKHSYEDDPEPLEILNRYDITLQNSIERYVSYIGTSSMILDQEPLSQRPARTKEEAYQWYKNFNGKEICHSLKIDGISTRILLSSRTGLVQEAYSKGRNQSLTNFTTTVKKKLNKGVLARITGSEGNNILVAAEGIVDNSGLGSYKNGRSAALGILATDINQKDIPHLHLFAFGFNQLSDNYSKSLQSLEALGFEIVPMIVTTFNDTGFNDFSKWIDKITASLKQQAINLDIQADGVVARLNDNKLYCQQSTNELYSNGSIALKFNEFTAKTYKAIVKNITLEFQGSSSENYTTKITINPILTDDNKTISKITGYNLGYIMNKKIKVGSQIDVLYQSGCYPMLG